MDIEKFITFMRINSPVYQDINNDLNDPDYNKNIDNE